MVRLAADAAQVAFAEHDKVLNDVSSVLWRERRLLELLVFKLDEEQLLLSCGRARWVSHASREVEIVLDELREAELLRAVQVEEAAQRLGLGSFPGLASLAEAVPEPWQSIFACHREALLVLTREINDLSERNRHLLAEGRDAAREALGWLSSNGARGPQAAKAARPGQSASGPSSSNEAI